jgi:hypothetical protein
LPTRLSIYNAFSSSSEEDAACQYLELTLLRRAEFAQPLDKAEARELPGQVDGSRLRPILDTKIGHCAKVAVLRHHDAVAEASRDRGELDVDLLHCAPRPNQVRCDSAKFLRRALLKRPDDKLTLVTLQQLQVAFA